MATDRGQPLVLATAPKEPETGVSQGAITPRLPQSTCGASSSTTSTEAVQESVAPNSSVTVRVTSFVVPAANGPSGLTASVIPSSSGSYDLSSISDEATVALHPGPADKVASLHCAYILWLVVLKVRPFNLY